MVKKKRHQNAPGQGRPKLPYATTQLRVPVPLIGTIKEQIRRFKKENTK